MYIYAYTHEQNAGMHIFMHTYIHTYAASDLLSTYINSTPYIASKSEVIRMVPHQYSPGESDNYNPI